MNLKLKSSYSQLYLLTAILVIINVIIITNFDITVSRICRLSSLLLLFVFFLFQKGFKSPTILIIFLIFIARDGAILSYENSLFKTTSFVLSIAGYLGIATLSMRKVRLLFYRLPLIVFAVVLLGLNIFNVYYLSDVVEAKLDNELQLSFFFIQGAVILFMGLIAYLYNNMYKGPQPLIYLYLVMALILADLCGLAAYFFGLDVAYFPERIFYLLGVALLVHCAVNLNKLGDDVDLEIEEGLMY